jgi:hypothetical protein
MILWKKKECNTIYFTNIIIFDKYKHFINQYSYELPLFISIVIGHYWILIMFESNSCSIILSMQVRKVDIDIAKKNGINYSTVFPHQEYNFLKSNRKINRQYKLDFIPYKVSYKMLLKPIY